MKRWWLLEGGVLIVGMAVFLGLCMHQIELPGLHTDEALEVLPAMQLLRGLPVECFRGACLSLFGRHFPLMIADYVGTVNTYLAIPFFWAFGINVFALRLMAVTLSAVALIFVYLFVRDLAGRWAAMGAYLLLSVNPSFVFWSRQGVFVTSATIPLAMAGLWAWLRWWRTRKAGYLYLGSFLFGLGLSAKFLFLWLLIGVGGSFLILQADRVWAAWRDRSLVPLRLGGVRWRSVLLAGVFFLLGLGMLLIYNLQTGATIELIRQNFRSSYYGVDNTDFLFNLGVRLDNFRALITGNHFWYLGGVFASWRYPMVLVTVMGALGLALLPRKVEGRGQHWLGVALPVLCGAVAAYAGRGVSSALRGYLVLASALAGGVVVALLRRRREESGVALLAGGIYALFYALSQRLHAWPEAWMFPLANLVLLFAPCLRVGDGWRRALFPWAMLALMIPASCFTVSSLWVTHYALLSPWPPIAVAVTLSALAGGVAGEGWKRVVGGVLAVALVGVLIYDDVLVDLAYHRELARSGGEWDHTSAIYDLAEYLDQHGITDPVAVDWGIQDPIQLLTAGRVNPEEIFGYEWQTDPGFAERVRERLADPDRVYIFHAPQWTHFQRWEDFQRVVGEAGGVIEEVTTIYNRSSVPMFVLVRVRQ